MCSQWILLDSWDCTQPLLTDLTQFQVSVCLLLSVFLAACKQPAVAGCVVWIGLGCGIGLLEARAMPFMLD